MKRNDRKGEATPLLLLPHALQPTNAYMVQELAASEDVAPYICGAVVAEGPVFPGQTWRGQLDVNRDICPDPVYSVVSMLSECASHLSSAVLLNIVYCKHRPHISDSTCRYRHWYTAYVSSVYVPAKRPRTISSSAPLSLVNPSLKQKSAYV